MLDKFDFNVLTRINKISLDPDGSAVYLYKEKIETTGYFNNAYSAAKFVIKKNGSLNIKELKKFCANCMTFIDVKNLDDVTAANIWKNLYKYAVNLQADVTGAK